ncbi:MAG: protocatechuate 3,4-dioxygenase [Planctomycetota bacterium]
MNGKVWNGKVSPTTRIDDLGSCDASEMARLDRRRLFSLGIGSAAFAGLTLGGAGMAEAWWAKPGAFAEALAATVPLTEGPFYPDKLPLDTDNDLLRMNDSTRPAIGEITHFSGRVLTRSGQPLRGVTVEIWQCDADGSYIHSRGKGPKDRDPHFQGFGRFLTDSSGRYYFRTIKPVAYGSRTPHIHLVVNRGDKRLLTTQALVRGEPMNQRDGVFRRVKDKAARETLLVDFKKIEDSKVPQYDATFDVVLNQTAFEGDDGIMRAAKTD